MLRAVVTRNAGGNLSVSFVAADEEEGAEEGTAEEHHLDCEFPENNSEGVEVCGEGPNPIMPEMKELAWTAGTFIVFALLMRFVLFPRLKKGMDARYGSIRADHEGADAARAKAQAEVAEYQTQLVSLKSEAAARVDAARQQFESERAAKLAEVNARIAEKRAAAAADADAARAAVHSQIESAVSSVASRATELTLGKAPAAGALNDAVSAVMSVGAGR